MKQTSHKSSTLIWPTDEEEAEINRQIAEDPDTMELTDEMMAQMRPASEVHPELVADYKRRVRGRQKQPVKVLVSLRLDPDVIEALKNSGRGWQGRANDALRQMIIGPKAVPRKKAAQAS